MNKDFEMDSVISIKNLNKIYKGGFQALKDINLEIRKGEIFALLGPNGAGKTTLINIVAGLTARSAGEVLVLNSDVVKDYQFTRKNIGLVQQEINSDTFFNIEEVVTLQAGYFGIANPKPKVEEVLKELSLWDKRKEIGIRLSGGMKRRVMIAKAMVHDPEILFLDEPTAGVDIELRANLWGLIGRLKERCKTIILTTHYLEEAERLADRIGIINNGRLILVEEKEALLKKYGQKLDEIYLNLINEDRGA